MSRRPAKLAAWLAISAALLPQIPAMAAEAPLPPERPRDSAPSEPANETLPYQLKLERLAELMGRLAFLRDVCPPGDGAVWRGKMQDLLTAEGSTPARRDRLAGAFNRGFDGYRLTYRSCTPAAELIVDRSMTEGSQLARAISSRFGG